MYNLDKKQKTILIIIIAIIIGFICYYVYAKDEEENSQIQNNLEIKNIEEQKEDQGNDKDEIILVHVSGAVNNEGIVELKIGSRISDAIDKSRWYKGGC